MFLNLASANCGPGAAGACCAMPIRFPATAIASAIRVSAAIEIMEIFVTFDFVFMSAPACRIRARIIADDNGFAMVTGFWIVEVGPRFCGGDNEGPRVIPASTVIPAKAALTALGDKPDKEKEKEVKKLKEEIKASLKNV